MKKRERRKGQKAVSNEAFVRAWQTSSCVADVVSKLGLSHQNIYARSKNMRRVGIPLKALVRPYNRIDKKALTKLAKSLEK